MYITSLQLQHLHRSHYVTSLQSTFSLQLDNIALKEEIGSRAPEEATQSRRKQIETNDAKLKKAKEYRAVHRLLKRGVTFWQKMAQKCFLASDVIMVEMEDGMKRHTCLLELL